MAVSLDETSMTVSFCNGRTPTSEPSAPAAASTVARPIKSLHRHQLGAIPEWKLDESAIPPFNETSLGLLPPEILDQTSAHPVWKSPDLENLDGSYVPSAAPERQEAAGPTSTPGSATTVIKVPENLDGTRDERFSDFSAFSDAPAQNFSDDFCQEQFPSRKSDVRSFLDAEEAENREKYRFCIENEEIQREEEDSMFEYLRKGSSRVGKSLDDESSLYSGQRPDFGLEGKIESPKYRPVPVLIASDESIDSEDQESAPGGVLEKTQELIQHSGNEVDLVMISKILTLAPVGKTPEFYAELVLNAYSAKAEDETVDFEEFLPSFIEEDKENKKVNLRHSSPIKSNQKKQEDVKRFPVESDRVSLHFFNVGVDSEEDKFLVIRNTMENSFLRVRLIIRGGECFKFKENWAKSERVHDQGLDVKMPPGSKRDIFVTFKPRSGGFFNSELVIKPHNGHRMKAKINLTGYGGNADIRIYESEKLIESRSEISCVDRVDLVVANLGDAAGFYKVLVFSEPDECVEAKTIGVTNSTGVVEPGQEVKVGLKPLDSLKSPLFVVIYKGGDLIRRVYCQSKSQSELFPPISHTNFDISSCNSLPVELSNKISPRDTCHLYEKLQKMSFVLRFKEDKFVRLPVEETLSESAIFPEREFAVESSFPAASQLLKNKKKRHREGVYLEKEVVEFNSCSSASVIGKVTVRNRTANHETFQLPQVQPPFYSYHSVVTVQPHHYLSIPIKFKPQSTAEKNSEQIFTIQNQHLVLTATLKGSSMSLV